MPEDSKDRLIDIRELAAKVGVSASQIYKMVANGDLPGSKIGKHWRFRESLIDKWIDSRGNNQAAALLQSENVRGASVAENAPKSELGARSISNRRSSPSDKTPSSDLEGAFSPAQIQALADRWITTADQFILMAEQPIGRDGMAKLLGIAPENVAAIGKSLAQRLG